MKRVLWLGPPSPVGSLLTRTGLAVCRLEDAISPDSYRGFDLAVSYRYRHIVPARFIDAIAGNIFNLHISLLPWNRGADPNLWSFLEDTPKGATLHWMDSGVDTGDVLAQQETFFSPNETLATTYRILEQTALDMLEHFLPAIVTGQAPRRPQADGGSFHRSADKKPYVHLLTEHRWDTPVSQLIGKGLSRIK